MSLVAGSVTLPSAGSLAASPPESMEVSTDVLQSSAPGRTSVEQTQDTPDCEPSSSVNVCSLDREGC